MRHHKEGYLRVALFLGYSILMIERLKKGNLHHALARLARRKETKMSQQQNDARLMCEYPIFGTVSDVSHMNTGVIYVRPCYFKPGVDKEIVIFLRDAKKERWAIADNLKVGTKLTFRISLDPYKGPMATDLHTVAAAPKDVYSEPYRPECIPDARGFRRIIDAAKRRSREALHEELVNSSDPIDKIFVALGF